ncbi:MAG: M20/M25/M40 family metallo-hydrolase, partial [Bacilli bacterium]|nr:M20/M25/M40 family metallo-hydrolase [Bacilli bacterium]
SMYHVKIQFKIHEGLIVGIISEEAYDLMEQAIITVVGANNLKPRITTPGGEDFHFYSLHKPNLKATMLGLGCGLSPGLHHPKMTFNHESIYTGIEILTQTILNTIQMLSKASVKKNY